MGNSQDEFLNSGWRGDSVTGYVFGIMRRQFWVLSLLPLVAVGLGFVFIIVTEPLYTATAAIDIQIDENRGTETVSQLSTHIARIQSDQITMRVIGDLDLDTVFESRVGRLRSGIRQLRQKLGFEDNVDVSDPESQAILITNVLSGLSVGQLGDTSIITVSYTSPSRSQAVAIANAWANAYVDLIAAREERIAARRVEILHTRTDEVSRKLAAASQSAQDLLARSGFNVIHSQELENRAEVFRDRLSSISSDETAVTARLRMFSVENASTSRTVASLISDDAAETRVQLAQAQSQLDQLRSRYGESGASLRQTENAIATLHQTLDLALERAREEQELELAVLAAQREGIIGELDRILGYSRGGDWFNLRKAEQDVEIYQDIYQSYLNQLENFLQDDVVVPVSLATEARASAAPSFPNYTVILVLAAVTGIVAAVMLAFIREWMRAQAVNGRASARPLTGG